MELTDKDIDELRECLELLNSIECIEYHNKNWLGVWMFNNPKGVNQEKRNLLERALKVVGTSSSCRHT